MVSDSVYKRTARQISKEYNDALEAAIKKNRKYLDTVNKVQSGKIAPPVGLKTEKQIEAWKRGYLSRYAKKVGAVDSMVAEMEAAGVKCRKSIVAMMQKTYGLENKATIAALDAKGIIAPKTEKQIQVLLDSKMTVFDKGALKSLENGDLARKRLRREFAQGLVKGDSDKKMVARIRRVTGMEESEAMRVLETERTRVVGMSQQATAEEYFEETGMMPRKKWICSFHNSRDSHMEMHGLIVNMNEAFPNGLRYPGDESGPPEETINCRCRMEILK